MYTKELEGKIEEEKEYTSTSEGKLTDLSGALEDIVVPATLTTFYKSAEEAYEHKHNLESLHQQYETKKTKTILTLIKSKCSPKQVYKK